MELSVSTCDLQWELAKKVLINLPCINYKTLSSVHARPPRASPLVISKHALSDQGSLRDIEVDPHAPAFRAEMDCGANTLPRLFF